MKQHIQKKQKKIAIILDYNQSQRVVTLVDEKQEAGYYEKKFNARN